MIQDLKKINYVHVHYEQIIILFHMHSTANNTKAIHLMFDLINSFL